MTDTPLTLEEACKLYPGSSFKVATLRAAADKGLLEIFLLGRRYHTTRIAMDEWVQRCRVKQGGQGFTWTGTEKHGSSATDTVSSARAGANQAVSMLKSLSKNTSARSTSRSPARTRS